MEKKIFISRVVDLILKDEIRVFPFAMLDNDIYDDLKVRVEKYIEESEDNNFYYCLIKDSIIVINHVDAFEIDILLYHQLDSKEPLICIYLKDDKVRSEFIDIDFKSFEEMYKEDLNDENSAFYISLLDRWLLANLHQILKNTTGKILDSILDF